MNLFRRSPKKKRVVVIGLDGVPFSFLEKETAKGRLPHIAGMLASGSMSRMNSSYPYVSGVAWTNCMTGKNPGKHGVYGFIDRKPDSYGTYIPTSKDVKSQTLPQIVTQAGKRVCVLGVPMSYPPYPINGVMVGCFLSPALEKATYPPSLASQLIDLGYRVDVDPWAARESLDLFLADYRATLKARGEAILSLLRSEPWDFFIAHVIETDRLHHFMWSCYDDQEPMYYQSFLDCYSQVDELVGRITAALDEDDELLVISDHGSCSARKDVFLNRWLVENGYLKLGPQEDGPAVTGLDAIDSGSVAYSLDPGRIYANLQGREPRGAVAQGQEHSALLDRLSTELLALRDPETGAVVVTEVLKGADIYRGECIGSAPDLLVMSADGFDMKGSFDSPAAFATAALKGMHTFGDAAIFARNRRVIGVPAIEDIAPTVLSLMQLPIPPDMDGRMCLG